MTNLANLKGGKRGFKEGKGRGRKGGREGGRKGRKDMCVYTRVHMHAHV